ncbi:hypothetical protein JVU11DRAFT_9643 [Chiua virens]|nr:hypothetical protein JVU11DRAFT_9643 [Chiua virens]
MSSPLVRVPFTLLTAAAFHVSMSPPTAPSTPLTSHADADKRVNKRAICATARFIAILFTKGVYWTSAVGDAFILLAPYLPIATIATPSMFPSTLLSRISHPTAWIPTPATIQTALLNLSHLLPHPHPLPRLPLLTIAGTTLTLSGALLRSSAFRALGQFYACTNTGPGPCKPTRPSGSKPRGPYGHAHALITTGPYAYVRHPGYAGTRAVHGGSSGAACRGAECVPGFACGVVLGCRG